MERSKAFEGRRRGKLVVLQKVEDNIDRAKEKWEVKCDCGTVRVIFRNSFFGLRSCGCLANTKGGSLGVVVNKNSNKKCLRSELTPDQLTVYPTWVSLHQRCNIKKSHLYPDYGGRGIKVCKEWNNFFTFFKDMGPKPGVEYSIERNNVDEGYCRTNCQWLLKTLQSRNTRKTVRIIYENCEETLIDFLERTGFNKRDFSFVTLERKKNGLVPVEVTTIVHALCDSRGWKLPKAKNETERKLK